MVMIVVVIMMIVMVMVVIMVVLIVIMMIVMVMVVIMMIVMVMVVIMMVFVVIVRVMVMMVLIVIIMIVMVMVVVMMVLIVKLRNFCHELRFQILGILYRLQDLLPIKRIPRCRDDGRLIVMLTDDLECGVQFALADIRCPAQDDRACMLDLVQEELPEILRVHPALVRVNDDDSAVQLHLGIGIYVLHRFHDIRKLSHTRRLDQDPLRMIRLDHFLQGTAKIPYQGTADAS